MKLDEVGPIIIIGAGPAGSLMATYLGQAGHDVVVYESRPDMREVSIEAGRSINLALATRGIVPLIDIGVMGKVSDILIPMRGRAIHTHPDGGNTGASVEIANQAYGARPNEVIHSVARSDLNATILDAAEATGHVEIKFEQRCRKIDFDRMVITLTDEAGTSGVPTGSFYEVPFGVVFGTDGSASPVREAMVDAGVSDVSIEPLDHGYKELTLAADNDGGFQLDPNALHIWPRGQYMLIALANPAKDFTVTLFLPSESVQARDDDPAEQISFESLQTPEAVEAFFAEQFGDLAALIPDLTEQFFANPTGKLATVRTAGWSNGNKSVLLGDASHAVVPFHGQGMNAAMESCRVLQRCLQAHPDDLSAAFVAFEAERKQDVDAIADMALNNYIEMRSSVVDPDYLLKRELALELEKRWPERISPRYSMVMFSTMPYSEAMQRAAHQAEILTVLSKDASIIDEVDFHLAAELVAQLDLLPMEASEPAWH